MALNPAIFLPEHLQAAYYGDPRMKFYNQLMAQGSSNDPVASPVGGIARALQAVVGGYARAGLDKEYEQKAGENAASTARVLNAKPMPWQADQSILGAMNTSAGIESESNPLVAPLAQTLALANADPAKQEKEMQLRIMKALLGEGAGVPGGTPSAPSGGFAPFPAAPAGAPVDTTGVNAPMALPGGGGAAPAAPMPAAATSPTGALDISGIATDPRKAMMLGMVMPKGVEAAQAAVKLQNEMNPLPAALQKETAKKAAESVALNQEIQSKGSLALQAVQRMKDINEGAPAGDSAGAQAFVSRNASALGMGDGQAAKDYSELKQLSALIKAMDIKPLFQGTGQIRVAELKMLDDIENIKPNLSAPERKQLLENVTNLIKNQMTASQQRATALSTPGKSLDANFTSTPFAPAGAAAPGAGGRVPIITPDGKQGTIDAAHLQELIAAGGKVLQ